MPETRAQRTLVKSPPELWAEISDAAALARRLDAFGEIRITRLEPETAVAWEGETARGTVELEPSGWGTRVTLTAEPVPVAEVVEETEPEAEPAEPVAEAEPEPADVEEEPEAEPTPEPRRGFFARLFGRRRTTEPEPDTLEAAVEPEPTPEPVAPPEPAAPPEIEPEITATAEADTEAPGLEDTLAAILDGLGSANHRPFSRS